MIAIDKLGMESFHDDATCTVVDLSQLIVKTYNLKETSQSCFASIKEEGN